MKKSLTVGQIKILVSVIPFIYMKYQSRQVVKCVFVQ